MCVRVMVVPLKPRRWGYRTIHIEVVSIFWMKEKTILEGQSMKSRTLGITLVNFTGVNECRSRDFSHDEEVVVHVDKVARDVWNSK